MTDTEPRDPFAPEVLHPVVDLSTREWMMVVEGDPVAKGRPKFAVRGGHAMAYTPAKTRRYESIIRENAVRQWNRPLLQDIGVNMRLVFTRAVPASWSKRKTSDALAGTVRPFTKPDLDNLVKSVTDGLNGVVYYDDAQIVETTQSKVYGPRPGVAIWLKW